MRRLPVILGVLFLILALVLTGGGFWVYAQFKQPGPFDNPSQIIITSGSSISVIARDLKSAGLIDEPLIFRLATRYTHIDKGLQAGEFAIPARSSIFEILDILRFGKTIIHRLTIAEGLSVSEVIKRLNNTPGLSGNIDVLPAEGSLLPETYHFSFGDNRTQMIDRMKSAMTRTLSDLWQKRAPGLVLQTPQEALILASMVEKETGQSGERGRVAAVFLNRLTKGMRLQSDPTVSYGLTLGNHPLGRGLTRADLKKPTPYNTYTIKKLPPTPITNPGQAAIKAVLNPPETDEFYFVANGKGGHMFAKTLKQHNRNVRKWRQIEKSLSK